MKKYRADRNNALNIYNVFVENLNQSLYCSAKQSVLEILTSGGIFLEANCGGRGSCGKCKIFLLDGQVNGPGGLSANLLQDNTYLACQIYPAGNIIIRVKQLKVSNKGNVATVFTPDGLPVVQKFVVTLDSGVTNYYSLQERLGYSLPQSINILNNIGLLKQLAWVVDKAFEQITVVAIGNEIAGIEAGDTAGNLFGLAFDIGTTTVVGMLVDINNYKVVATFSETNPQAAFGADIISRINAAKINTGITAQSEVIRQCLNRITSELCTMVQVDRKQIYAVTIVGNSAMLHLLLSISPVSLSRQPYATVFKTIPPFAVHEIELNINSNAKVVLLPNIASFIGADTTAAILAAGQDTSANQSLMVDLGTNGEIALGNQENIFACSTAAGPAFEGAHIRDGMRASAGAIEDVVIDEDVVIRTIDGGKPMGICGSGIIKAIAQLLKKKIITASGRFNQQSRKAFSPALVHRLVNKENKWEFVLVAARDSATGYDISVTQKDIREIQLVKSAICTGIQVLIDRALPTGDMPVFLAGAFGNYVDIESAIVIGLLPKVMQTHIQPVGNAAGTGAVYALLSQNKLARCRHIAGKVHYVELAAEPDFQERFLANLSFPNVI